MKKTFLILLVLLFCCATSIEAKVEFGNWSKWEKEFPSISRWEKYIDLSHSFYNQCTDTKTAYTVCSMFTCSICNERECKEKASVVLFSTKDKTMDDMYYGKGDYQFALVAFPPVENMVIIRAYKREKKILKFLEEWEIPLKTMLLFFQQMRPSFYETGKSGQ